jgi:rhodanese-related sulfurtransferase
MAATPTPEIPSTTPLVRTLTAREAFDLIQENKNNKDFMIIDVRTKDEFDGGHIAAAVNIDYYAADFRAKVDKLDRSKQYLVYCRTGVRSAAASQIFEDLGFREIYNLGNGINRWIQDGYPIVK